MPSLPPLLVVALGLSGCAPAGDDSAGGELPPEDTGDSGEDSGLDTFTYDTYADDTGFDVEPKHLLTMLHEGEWDMSPNGGPWETLTGELRVTELLDGDDLNPTCEVRFALTGEASEEGCAGCDAAFDVLHYVAEGDRTTCRDPELPEDGAVVRMGWSDAEEAVFLDWQGSGVWLRWYDGERIDDSVRFAWEATVGVTVEEEDP